MRRGALVTALAALFAVALMAAKPTQAMPISAPAGLAGAAEAIDITENVTCSVVWRCGYYGCGWRRVCWGAPYYGYGYSRPYYGYRYYRPWYRPYYGYGYYRPWARPYYGYGYYRPWARPYYGYRWGYRRYW
jgi:hypothetical protein